MTETVERPASDAAPSSGSKKEPKAKKPDKQKPPQGQGKDKKKETKLGLSTKKSENFGEWYSEVVVESEMISYYSISGCYIMRPWSFFIWDAITKFFDGKIKALGVQNAYFPLFVTEEVLNTEKDHVEGFAPEVAWVTRSGKSEMDRPIAIRPTSETVMYPYYAVWIRSHRDLPLRLNQWTNVVRWEFKYPTPFIRNREFLWQEGHTAFATKEEADKEVYEILDLYRRVYEELLAVPVCKGIKTENEKFAGADYTTSVEGFVPATGRGVQCGTSHHLGQNFAKMFGIEFETEERTKQYVYQNSWGLSTRSIGVMVMVHGDDKGLVLPPRVASIQVVLIPIPKASMSDDQLAAMTEQVDKLAAAVADKGIRTTTDKRSNYNPGWKYNYWELRGVPLRIELGPKDMDNSTVVAARRDTGAKEVVSWEALAGRVEQILEDIQNDMYSRARAEFDGCMEKALDWDSFMAVLSRNHMALAPWCDEQQAEDEVKEKSAIKDLMGAKSLCKPLEQPDLPEGTKCFYTGKPAKTWCLFGRSY